MKNTLTVAQVQMQVVRNKAENIASACRLIRRAAAQGAELVMLPEMFCCPYENSAFRPYGETLGGPAQQALSALAGEKKIWIVGGSVPELEGERVYNTCFVYNPDGQQVARHRKMHLFDRASGSPIPCLRATILRCLTALGGSWGFASALTCGLKSWQG